MSRTSGYLDVGNPEAVAPAWDQDLQRRLRLGSCGQGFGRESAETVFGRPRQGGTMKGRLSWPPGHFAAQCHVLETAVMAVRATARPSGSLAPLAPAHSAA